MDNRFEMQKVADPADISVLFFSAGANCWAILGHFGPFWQFWVIFGPNWAILGNFWAILGNFRSFSGFFGANFLWQNMPLCYLNHVLQLCNRSMFYWMNDCSRDSDQLI